MSATAERHPTLPDVHIYRNHCGCSDKHFVGEMHIAVWSAWQPEMWFARRVCMAECCDIEEFSDPTFRAG